MTLSCPGCHAKHKFRDDIAVDKTVYVRCPACNHMMMISPQINNPAAAVTPRPEVAKDEAPALPPEIAAALAAARANLWRLELLDFARQEIDTDEVCRHVREGAIGPDDLIAHVDKNDWRRVRDVPELKAAVAARESGGVGAGPAPEVEEGADAVPERRREVPLWHDLPAVLGFPFSGSGPAALFFTTLFLVLATLTPVSMPLLLFNLTYGLTIVRDSAAGRRHPPGWDAITDPFDLFMRAVKVLILTSIAWSPLVVLDYFLGEGAGEMRIALNLPLSLLVIAYYAPALAVLAISGSLWRALSPFELARTIRVMGKSYARALALMLAMLVLGGIAIAVLTTLAGRLQRPWLGTIPAAAITVYTSFVGLHVLGRLAHDNGARLGWDMPS